MKCPFCDQNFETLRQQNGHKLWCHQNPESKQRRNKMKNFVNEKISKGTWHNSFSHCRRQSYKNQIFDGMWEVHLAKWFDENNIEWKRNTTSFKYTFDQERNYTPDFYIPNIDCYVEVKGWKTPKDEAKWNQFPKRLIILSGSDLQALGIPITVHKDWKL